MLPSPVRGRAIRGGKARTGPSPRAKPPLGASTSSASTQSFAVTQTTAAKPASTSKSVGRLIVGIDVGTTQCAVATAEILYGKQNGGKAQSTPRVKLYEGWIGFYMNHSSTPCTAMYYEEDGTPLTGNDLQPLFDNANPKSYRPDRLIRLWKLMFHHHQNKALIANIQGQIQKQLDMLGKTMDDLMRDWARLLFDHLFTEGSGISSLRQIYPKFDQLDLELVVAVPPGRSTIAHEQVLQSFIQGPIKSTTVSLESEPAALFRNWVQEGENDQDWVVGKRYLVADGGGGTCSFVRFRLDGLEPLRFAQEFQSESVVCGAETISDLFERLIATKIPENCPYRDWYIERIRNKFDTQYKLFVGSNDRALSFENPMKVSADDVITVTVDETKQCFALCIAALVEAIRRQLAMGEPVDYIVLGGGLFQNPHVLKSIGAEFKGLRLLETSKLKGAVAKGAVLSKIFDNFISNDEITRTKGNLTMIEVTPKLKKSKFFKNLVTKKGVDGRTYYWAVTYLVKQGQKSMNGREISTETSAKDARRHYLELDDDDLNFSEKIFTFNYRPGKDKWAALTKSGSWINERGHEIPYPEHYEKITWSPLADEMEVELSDLETERTKDGTVKRVLRYSLQLQVKETGTKYWAKMWSSDAMKRKTGESVWSLSQPVERQPLFTPQAISQSLADSFKFDDSQTLTSTSISTSNASVVQNSAEVARPNLAAKIQRPAEVAAPNLVAKTPKSTEVARPNLIAKTQRPAEIATPSLSAKTQKPAEVTRFSFSAKTVEIIAKPSTVASTFTQSNGFASTNKGQETSLPSYALPRGPVHVAERPIQQSLVKPGQSSSQFSQPVLKQNAKASTSRPGALRRGGGCWTCSLRHASCNLQKPKCWQCEEFGLQCDYIRPAWWDDDQLKGKQTELYRLIVKQSNTVKKLGSSSKPTRSMTGSTTPNMTTNSSLTQQRVQSYTPGSGTTGSQSSVQNGSSFSSGTHKQAAPAFDWSKRSRDSDGETSTPQASKRRRLENLFADNNTPPNTSGSPIRKSDQAKVQRSAPDMRTWGSLDDEDLNGSDLVPHASDVED
ncbi:uncharacterized protein LY89DRAFT_783615 [Mollisia scopiformis]|uniref:Zn(2)-C6 fungal-type domain-containing protein n=1 Tax=Mollisia scopiformis TaxID=149040 RepID=A0A194X5Y5_MOLSC|nr:uncharacterized protein LY89DRAFT_783615 [Mollisia scopiformis]KUJ15479.1 hypothetical protein LY89DRAFT_783615 [Mollisia scopiformis]